MYKARNSDLLDRIEELDESNEAENPLGEYLLQYYFDYYNFNHLDDIQEIEI